MWRMIYNMPPNDERFLNITEEEIAHDLLVVWFHRYRETATPELDALAESVEKFGEVSERARGFLEDAGTRRAIDRITKGGTPDELAEKQRPQTITIGRTTHRTRPVDP